MIYAIRSKTGRVFRRSEVAFHPDKWTLTDNPTPEQLAEENLECFEVSGPNDPILARFEVLNPELSSDASAEPAAESEGPSHEQLLATVESLRKSVSDRDKTIVGLEKAAEILKGKEPVAEKVIVTFSKVGECRVVARGHIDVDFAYAETLPIDPPDEGFVAKDVDLTALVPSEWIEDDAPDTDVDADPHQVALTMGAAATTDQQVQVTTPDPFEGIKGLGTELRAALINAGIADVAALRAATDEQLLAINGIGDRKLAELRAQLQ